jgi:ATP-dependent Lhr-like helicase
MAHPERQLIEQTTDGDLMLGEIGERIAASHDFYAVFESKAEFRVIEGMTRHG